MANDPNYPPDADPGKGLMSAAKGLFGRGLSRGRDRYELGERLGSGAMGVVYRGRDRTTNKEVALKTLIDARDPALLRRFYEECRKLSALPDHPNLIEIRDLVELEADGVRKPFLVMSFVRGESLAAIIARQKPMPVTDAVKIGLQVLRGLQAAHEGGVIHRDIKPSNIMVLADGSVKLIDFGLAHSAGRLPQTTMGAGTPLYCSPEQTMQGPLGPASDLFSAGVVVYEMLTGAPPFSGKSEADLNYQIRSVYPPSVAQANPQVNESIARVLHKAMAKKASHRFSSAVDFGNALERAFHNQAVDDVFDSAYMRERLHGAETAFAAGELDDAQAVADDLADAYLDENVFRLRAQIRLERARLLVATARRRIRAREFSAALSSVEQALALDADNRTAQMMREEIAAGQAQEEIDRLQQSARKRIEGFEFDDARKVLAQLSEKRPDDPELHRLQSQLRRSESEYVEAQRAVNSLYDAAVNDFQRGKVGAALERITRVLELDAQWPRTDRTRKFEAFQAELISARQELETAELQVKNLAGAGQFDEALKLCSETLRRYPDNAGFEALRMNVEQSRRRHVVDFVAAVESELGAEPDLDKQLEIISRARQQFPNEPRLAESADLIERRKELVDRLLENARAYIEQGEYAEAIAEYRRLKEVHPQRPDTDRYIQQLEARRLQQEQSRRLATLARPVQQAIEAGNFDEARKRLAEARQQAPDETEWGTLAAAIEQRAAEVQQSSILVDEGRRLLEAGEPNNAVPKLEEALRGDPGNTQCRRYLVEALLAHAKSLFENDWRAAAPLVQRAFEIEPKHPLALSLGRAIEGRRAAEASAALPPTEEIQLPKRPRLSAQPKPAAPLPPVPVQEKPAQADLAETLLQPPPPYVPPQPPAPQPSAPPSPAKRPFPLWAWLTPVAAVLFIGGGLLYTYVLKQPAKPKKPASAIAVPVAVRTNPPGAQVFVDDKPAGDSDGQALALDPGSYKVEVRKPGYQPRVEQVKVEAGGVTLNWTLVPRVQDLLIETNLEKSKYRLDQGEPAEFAGSVAVPELKAGPHALQFIDSKGQVDLKFEVQAAGPPRIEGLPQARGLAAVALSFFAGRATLLPSRPGMQVQWDQGEFQTVPAEGLPVPEFSGTHEMTVRDSGLEWKRQIAFGPETRLSLYTFANLDIGTLLLTVQPEGALMSIDNWKSNAPMLPGPHSFQIPVGKRKIIVEKQGFQPQSQLVDIKKGQQTALNFTLAPLVTTGTIRLKSTPGAEVFVNDSAAGAVRGDGTLDIPNLAPGWVTVRVQKRPAFKDVTRSIQIPVGTVDLELPVADKALSRLTITGLPSGGSVRFRRRTETTSVAFEGTTRELPEGDYLFSASAPSHTSRNDVAVTLEAGVPKTLDLALQPERAAPKPTKPAVAGMSGWPNGHWAQDDDGWYSGAISGFSLYGQAPLNGVVRFSVELPQKGSFVRAARSDFYIGYVDNRNFVRCSLEPQKLSCESTADGKTKKWGTLQLGKAETRAVTVDITPSALKLNVDGKALPDLDADATGGRFGFLLDAKKKTRIRDFRFNAH